MFAIAQRLFTKYKRWRELAINLNVNGAAAVAREDLPAARDYYRQVIELATKTGDLPMLDPRPRQPRYDLDSDGGCGCRRGR